MTGHLMKRKAEFYLEDKKKVHLSLKSGSFYNGFIIEVRLEFMIFNDAVLGKIPVFYSEIKDDGLEPYTEKGG